MTSDLAGRPRLLIPVEPIPGESLLGLIMRACDENLIESTAQVLRAAGYGSAALGYYPTNTPEDDAVLAHILCLPVVEVASRMHRRIASTPDMVSFFGTAVRSVYRETRIRRVSPASLAEQPFHRAIWDLKPITFCPFSWERLTGECPICGARLLWRQAAGTWLDKPLPSVAVCACCHEDVRGYELEPVASDDRPPLKLLCELLDPATTTRARASLPDALSGTCAGLILDLAVAFGRFLSGRSARERTPVPQGKYHWGDWSHDKLASGMRALLDWPNSFSAFPTDPAVGAASVQKAHARAIKRFVRHPQHLSGATPLLESISAEALAIAGRTHRVFFGRLREKAGHHSVRTARQELKLGRVQFSRLAAYGGQLDFIEAGPSVTWVTRKSVESSARQLARRRPISSFASSGLSVSIIEQLICEGIVPRVQNPVVDACFDEVQVDGPEVVATIERLAGLARRVREPLSGLLRIERAIKVVGGRDKPWAALLHLLLSKSISCYLLENERFSVQSILIPAEIMKSMRSELFFYQSYHPNFPFDLRLNFNESAQHLGLSNNPFQSARRFLRLSTRGQNRCFSRDQVEAAGQFYVSATEIALRCGLNSEAIPKHLGSLSSSCQPVLGRLLWPRRMIEPLI